MLRYFFYHLIWSSLNFIIRNPYARRVVGWGCLALVLLWVGSALLSALLGAIVAAAAGFSAWMSTVPDTVILAAGIGFALVAGAIILAVFTLPGWRERLPGTVRTMKAGMGRADGVASDSLGPGTTPILQSADDLDGTRIRILDPTESPDAALTGPGPTVESDDALVDQIVIHGKE